MRRGTLPILDRTRGKRNALSLTLPDTTGWRRILSLMLILCATLLATVAAITTYEVGTNFRDVRSEASDNVEWSLAQAELETRDFTAALEAAMLDPEASLDRLRLRYDIFYSRFVTIMRSPNYQRLNTTPEFDAALHRIERFVLGSETLIDGPDDALRAALPDLRKRSEHLRNDTRTLSLKGLTFFAEQADQRRDRVTNTFVRLTASTAALIAALIALIIHTFNIYRRTRQRGHALVQANVRMNTILTASFDGVIVVDRAARILEFNQACEDMFDYHFEDVHGKSFLEMLAPAHTRMAHAAAMERLAKREQGNIAGTGRIRMDAMRADGSIFPVEVAVEMAEENNQTIFIGFIHDISERVATERELVQARDRALTGEKVKAEFLTVMSHEIRTPLNGVLGNLNLLNDTALTSTQTRYVRNMEISGRVLMRHVDTVLNIARHEAGVLDVSLSNVDLSVLLQELIDSQLSAAIARGTSLSWRWEGAPRAWVQTDRAAVEQILLNLIGNAIKFTEGGTIIVEAEALKDTDEETSMIELRVVDTGVGIAPDRIDHVFDDFVTNDSTFGRVPGGTGLGLGIARRFAENMGGGVGVESLHGQGCAFWVRLPMAPGTRTLHSTTPRRAAPVPPMHILLVEDNPINIELAQDMLTRENHSVICATDGEQAVQAAERATFDVILMDIAMPVMNGQQATLAIRAGDGPNQNTPIVAISANILPDERKRLIAAGMNGFLGKPLNRSELEAQLRQIAQNSISAVTLTSDTPAAQTQARDTDQLLDTAAIRGNRAGLPEDTYHRLLARFLVEGDALNAAITAPYRQSRHVAKLCHDLASASAIFGARALHTALVEADTAAKQRDIAKFEQCLVTLPPLWRKTRAALETELPSDVAQ
ncbi:ATP-binding protein [Shimia sp.]|uniref:ATP-binding protein n=1 Tax=Shimia sp. TaxID=1954381 RepID=UPI003B8EA767